VSDSFSSLIIFIKSSVCYYLNRFLITVPNDDLFNSQSTSDSEEQQQDDEEKPPTSHSHSSSVVKAKRGRPPKNPTTTTTTTTTTSSGSSKQLCFGLRIVDETSEADVILHGADAEYFLGVTAREFDKNKEDLQQRVEDRLKQCQKNETVLDFYLRCFCTEEQSQKDGEDSADEEVQRGSVKGGGNKKKRVGANGDSSDVMEGESVGGDLTRRLQVFNTKLPL
jgi:hypothetical protein